MEHLRIDHQKSPLIGEGLTQDIYHYVYVRGRCSLVELFPLYARRDGFLAVLEDLLVRKLLFTDLKSIWARERQVIFTATPLSQPEETQDTVLSILNNQKHVVGANFTYDGAAHINRDFQLQWYKITLQPDEEFFLDHFYDFRGRIYPKGHIMTYQGTDFQKSLVRSETYEIGE
jgi:hypothetical protein